MGNHRAQAQFDRAKWRLLLLGPVWALQVGLSVAMMGLFSWRLGDTIHHYKDRDQAGKTPTIEFVWEVTNVVFSLSIAVCTLVEIAKYMAESLTPWTMLFTHVVKLACACAILILDVVIYVQRDDTKYSLVGLGMDVVLFITAISLAIYAVLAYRRLSKYDDYAYPVNIKSYGFNDGLERDNSYSSKRGLRPSMDKRMSSGSSRLSFQSIHSDPVYLQPVEQTASKPYSHERDTQFEEYLTRQGSVRSPGESSPLGEALGDSTTVGSVPSRSRGSSVSRNISFSSDHVLVAVPEEDGDVGDTGYQQQAALLGAVSHDGRHGVYTDNYDLPRVPQNVDETEPK